MATAVSLGRPVVGVTCDVLPVQTRLKYTTYDRYVRSLQAAGALALMLPPVPADVGAQLAVVAGVLLVGGDDIDPAQWGGVAAPGTVIPSHPQRTDYEMELVLAATAAGKSVLGVCLGLQTLNVARGGTLKTSLSEDPVRHSKHGPGVLAHHAIDVEPGSLLGRCLDLETGGRVNVNSSHRWAAEQVGTGLVVSARSGDGVVEALEDPTQTFCLGVQWHPEAAHGGDEVSRRLFAAFVRACAGSGDSP